MSVMMQAGLALVAVVVLTAVVWRAVPKARLRSSLGLISAVMVVLLIAVLIKLWV
ncbi:MAG: hypothetical protein LKJ29_07165 [Lactobacillus sp.]|nr:hypothetical protein [Lactobacillus sp.]MCI1918431.1 hypothetical protein [Lactobacillus sp.]MCI1941817.1 hypothetical protein [Lactobacillus sp.]MCI1972601.1 hypothetical protein [Lactobacillus sp.]MCI2038337.1 hypothetical protein [Lactobacillus sp.]